jgi:hypothetical protein
MSDMKARSFRFTTIASSAAAVALCASIASAGQPHVVQRGGAGARTNAAATAAVSYSVEVPVVTRVVGTALFRTAIDISNNTASGTTASPVVAKLQYSYNRVASDGTVSFFRTPDPNTPAGVSMKINLLAFDNFHQDDFVAYLGTLPGILQPGASQSSFGTLLITFEGLPSATGWEGTAFARTYSPNPTGNGTVAIAYPASLFFESANATLVATIRDTQNAPTDAGVLRTNIGIRNTDVRGTGQNVSVTLEFYDVTPGNATNGQRVGNVVTIQNLQPGEVRQINNVRGQAAIPANVQGMLVFADVVGATASSPTIEGYVNILDGGTQDGAFFEMKCSAGCATF